MRSHRIHWLALTVAVGALTACGNASNATSAATGNGVRLIHPGRLTVCAQLPYSPFEFERGGEVTGFDVDLLDLAARRLGVTREVRDTPFETIKTGAELNARHCDVGAGGMTITEERKRFIDYSDPYFDATQTLVAGPKVTATSLDQIKAGHLRLGSLASTTGEEYVTERGFDPRSYDLADALLNGLRIGEVDVVIMDGPVVSGWLKNPKNAGLHVVADLDTGERYGFAFRKGHSTALVQAVDDALRQARTDGSYRRVYEKWIGPYRGAR